MAIVSRIFSLIALLLLSCLIVAQSDSPTDPKNHFVNPPPAGLKSITDPTVLLSNPTYIVGSPQTITWLTNDTAGIILALVQDGAATNNIILSSGNIAQTYNWDGKIGNIDLSQGVNFFLGAWDSNRGISSSPLFFSHYFYLSPAGSSSTTPSTSPSPLLPSSATATSSSIKSPSITSVVPPTSSSIIATPSASPSSSNATDIGAGVGGGIGGALVIIAIVFWVLRHQKQQREKRDSGITTGMAMPHNHDSYRQANPPIYVPATSPASPKPETVLSYNSSPDLTTHHFSELSAGSQLTYK